MSETVNETTIGGVRITEKNVRQTLNSKLNNAFVNKQYNITKCFRTLLSFKRLKYPFYLEKNLNELYACLLLQNGPRSPGMDLVLHY